MMCTSTLRKWLKSRGQSGKYVWKEKETISHDTHRGTKEDLINQITTMLEGGQKERKSSVSKKSSSKQIVESDSEEDSEYSFDDSLLGKHIDDYDIADTTNIEV